METCSSKEKPMAISLYDLSVLTFLQTVSAVGGFLDCAATYCSETGADPDDFVDVRLFDDMAPFYFQIECVAHLLIGPVPFADLLAMITQAEAASNALAPDEVNS